MNNRKHTSNSKLLRWAQIGALVAIIGGAILVSGQSTKTGGRAQLQGSAAAGAASASASAGPPGKKSPSVRYNLSPSPGNQLRQLQQQQQQQREEQPTQQVYQSNSVSQRPAAASGSNAGSGVKRMPNNQQEIQQQQQQQQIDAQNDYSTGQQQQQQQQQATTEDPLSDSEPALYGSVAGQPGIDFPAYTTIPRTSFSCEGKGFDFGFYADEEAQCQVFHVCWGGRRESFLCGVGTVFNQAILACDYWHSVDCSKSSQFYGVNSELGK